MIRKNFAIMALALALLVYAQPALADGVPGIVYVDTSYTGTEDGTKEHPYNTLLEGEAFARAQSGEAWIFLKQPDDTWEQHEYIRPAVAGVTGIPLSNIALYSLLGFLALGLVLLGRQLKRRSRQLTEA